MLSVRSVASCYKQETLGVEHEGCTESIVTFTRWERGYPRAETTVQQTKRLHWKPDLSFVEEDAAFQNMYMSRGE
jgi:hypothetical protein